MVVKDLVVFVCALFKANKVVLQGLMMMHTACMLLGETRREDTLPLTCLRD